MWSLLASEHHAWRTVFNRCCRFSSAAKNAEAIVLQQNLFRFSPLRCFAHAPSRGTASDSLKERSHATGLKESSALGQSAVAGDCEISRSRTLLLTDDGNGRPTCFPQRVLTYSTADHLTSQAVGGLKSLRPHGKRDRAGPYAEIFYSPYSAEIKKSKGDNYAARREKTWCGEA